AAGLSVRFLSVTILAGKRTGGSFNGNVFSPARLAWNCATELGNTPTNRPLAIKVTVSCPEKVVMLGCGGCKLLARNSSRMSEPGKLSYGGRTQASAISAAK